MVFSVGMLVTLSLWYLAGGLVNERTYAAFENQSRQLKSAIEERLVNYEQVLAGSAGLFEVAEQISRNDWSDYIRSLDVEFYYPGIQGVGFARYVPRNQLEAHLATYHNAGEVDYLVHPEGDRPEYYPVVYIEPQTRQNILAYGFDPMGDPVHRRALEEALKFKRVAMTGKVVLVQEQIDESQPGFLLYYPVFSEVVAPGASPIQPAVSLQGFVFSAFRMNHLMDGIVGLISPFLDIRIYDSDVVQAERVMYASNLGSLENEFTFEYQQSLEHGGRTWLLVTRTTPAFDFLARDERPLIVMVSGTIVSCLLLLLMLVLIRARLEAQINAGKYRAITEDTKNITIIFDTQAKPLYLSPSCQRILGYTLDQALKLGVEGIVHPDDAPAVQSSFASVVKGHNAAFLQTRIRNSKGQWLEIEGSYTDMRDVPGVDGIVCNFHDVSELREVQSRLKQLAYYDSLTGLANRQLFEERLQHCIKSIGRREQPAALLFLDLDGFKQINDTLGHDSGDILLCHVARWLSDCVRQDDSVARFGGDEFLVLLSQVSGPEAVAQVAENILNQVCQRIKVKGHEVCVSTSIGIAMIPEDSEDAATLLKFADLAMYRAKELGRNRYQFFTKAINMKAARRMLMQEELRVAKELDQFSLYYQPTVRLHDHKIVGVEALLRWQHPERGLLNAQEFLDVAEDCGLMHSLGGWVLRQACIQAMALQSSFEELVVSVNFTKGQLLDHRFLEAVDDVLSTTGVQPEQLVFEFPADVVVDYQEQIVPVMEALQSRNIKLTLDDFGSGYCALGSMHLYPVTTIKIDRSLVAEILTSQNCAALSSGVVAMAKKLDISVIAEGVESAEQLNVLIESECEYAQGNLFSQPLPESRLAAFLTTYAGQGQRFI
ncbi:bifunctional diguanylate cyclase/phosphodiesterase [Oleiphilus messinensis]|nr:EAL domain-containing protein [Oleiphilus messinensis]